MAINRLSDVVGPANGLVKVIPTSVSVGSGSASVDTTGNVILGSGVSSVTVNGAFNATYDNYRIIVSGGSASTSGINIIMTLGATTSGYSYAGFYLTYGTATLNAESANSQAGWVRVARGTVNQITGNIDVFSPFLSQRTTFQSSAIGGATTDITSFHTGFLDNSTSYTGFTLTTNAGTMTGSTIRVYGYNN
jgi:hypothetical protein